jgi:hypothetical protein
MVTQVFFRADLSWHLECVTLICGVVLNLLSPAPPEQRAAQRAFLVCRPLRKNHRACYVPMNREEQWSSVSVVYSQIKERNDAEEN